MKSLTKQRNASSAKAANFLPSTAEVNIVDERVTFDGNIIPHAWLLQITIANGCADVIACMVLAEIVYWYRGVDVISGDKIVGRKRKFDGDYLQKSYADLAARLNLTKGQVSDAVIRLEKKNLIKREFRTLIIRGVKMSNVLFIRLFAWQVVEISNTAAPVVENDPMGYGNEAGDLPENIEGGSPVADDTSAGPVADKYREHIKDHPADHTPGKETSAAAESAEPTPADFQTSSEDKADGLSTEPGRMRPSARDEGVITNPGGHEEDSDKDWDNNDARRIRSVLGRAFGGLRFLGRDETLLNCYVDEGRITVRWAEALVMAKERFDRDRNYYKAKGVFIPVKPRYVISDYDRTTDGMVSLLGEMHCKLEVANGEIDDEEMKPYLQLFAEYDHFFLQVHRARLEGKRFVVVPGHESDYENLLIHPERFVHHKEGDPLPPAWMRIIYAYRRDVYTDRLRLTLLPQAQEELRSNPTGLKSLPEPFSDENVKNIFFLQVDCLLKSWNEEHKRRDNLMETLETLISEVTEIKATIQLGV